MNKANILYKLIKKKMEFEKKEWIMAKETVFDRIEQSFELFKNNFVKLILPLFAYSFATITIFMSVVSYFWMKYAERFSDNFDKNKISENLDWLNYSSEIVIWISVFIILIILYLTLYIPFWLATIKSIKQWYNWEEITVKENIIYWFKNIFNSFKTYWYVFAYVTLIPALIWIVWGFLSIYGMQFWDKNYTQIWVSISIFALIFFIFFSVYRWTKSSFYMSSAIDKNEFTKENFNFSVKITKNKFWRIIWNFLLIWLIISVVTWIANNIVSLFGSSFDFDIESLANLKENWNIEEIMNLVNETLKSYSPITNLILNSIETFIKTISTVFILIFTYILFKRLEIENNTEIVKEEKIEL